MVRNDFQRAGARHGRAPVMHAQLVKNMLQVGLDGVNRNRQLLRDLVY